MGVEMKTKMKAMRLHAINDFRLEEVDIPEPMGDEILLKVGACGICGSDIPRVYELGTRVYPITLGHEFGGEVISVGNPEDKDLIGRRAAVFPLIPCGECLACKTGNYCQCQNNGYLGSRNDGGFAEYCLIPSRWHLLLSNNEKTSAEDLAIVEPACVALHAYRKSGARCGDTVVIFGAGPIGILAARWCRMAGTDVILVDIDDTKAEFARQKGFTVINSMKEDCVERVRELTDGHMADVVIEGTGTSPALNNAIECCKPFAMIALLGNPHKDTVIKLNMHSNILRKELRLTGIWNDYYCDLPFNEWKYCVRMIDEGKLVVSDLVTHRADLDGLKQLFDGIHSRELNICKAIYSAQV